MHKYHKSCSLAHFTVLRLITTVSAVTWKISYLSMFCVQLSQIVFLVHLTVLKLIQLYELELPKFRISVSSVHNCHKSCSWLILPFYGLLQLYELELQKSQLREFSAQVSQIVFLAHLTVLRFITTVWTKTSKISHLIVQCTTITLCVLSYLTVLRLNTTVLARTSKIS